jgi:hypothetical protein
MSGHTNMRQSINSGPGDSAGDGDVGGVRVAPRLRTATAQMVSLSAVRA